MKKQNEVDVEKRRADEKAKELNEVRDEVFIIIVDVVNPFGHYKNAFLKTYNTT